MNAVYVDGLQDGERLPAEVCDVDELFYVRLMKWMQDSGQGGHDEYVRSVRIRSRFRAFPFRERQIPL